MPTNRHLSAGAPGQGACLMITDRNLRGEGGQVLLSPSVASLLHCRFCRRESTVQSFCRRTVHCSRIIGVLRRGVTGMTVHGRCTARTRIPEVQVTWTLSAVSLLFFPCLPSCLSHQYHLNPRIYATQRAPGLTWWAWPLFTSARNSIMTSSVASRLEPLNPALATTPSSLSASRPLAGTLVNHDD